MLDKRIIGGVVGLVAGALASHAHPPKKPASPRPAVTVTRDGGPPADFGPGK